MLITNQEVKFLHRPVDILDANVVKVLERHVLGKCNNFDVRRLSYTIKGYTI